MKNRIMYANLFYITYLVDFKHFPQTIVLLVICNVNMHLGNLEATIDKCGVVIMKIILNNVLYSYNAYISIPHIRHHVHVI